MSRLTQKEALDLFQNTPLPELQKMAHVQRVRILPATQKQTFCFALAILNEFEAIVEGVDFFCERVWLNIFCA